MTGFRFKSWPTNSTCMCGLCEPRRMTGASPRRLAHDRSSGSSPRPPQWSTSGKAESEDPRKCFGYESSGSNTSGQSRSTIDLPVKQTRGPSFTRQPGPRSVAQNARSRSKRAFALGQAASTSALSRSPRSSNETFPFAYDFEQPAVACARAAKMVCFGTASKAGHCLTCCSRN